MGIKVRWEGGSVFVGETEGGNKVTVEPGPKYGGSGRNPTPMELLAIAHGGCTGIDVLLIMQKMRVSLTKLDIDVEAKRRTEPPTYYEEIKLTYTASGDGVTEEGLRRAVELSHEKYCSVGAMLEEKAKITYDIKVV